MLKSSGRTLLSVVTALAIGSTLLTLTPPAPVIGAGGCDVNCSGNGVCTNFSAGTCACNPCSSGLACETVCSGNGTCLNSSDVSGFCSCNAGFSGTQCETAAQCGPGFFSASGFVPCTQCPSGTATNQSGSTSCPQCDPGTFASGTGNTQCQDCGVGQYASGSGNSGCSSCDPGSYANTPGSPSCTPCDPGTATNSSASINCPTCPAGSFTDTPGQTTCAQCSPGSFAPSTGSTACTSCNAGTFQPSAGATAPCTNCSAGQYQPLAGQPSCLSCPSGSAQPAPGSSACNSCPAGTAQPAQGTTSCVGCTAGTFASGTGNATCSTCTTCPSGQFESAMCTATGDTGCSVCDPSCTECSGPTPTECTSCPSGNPPVSGECLPGCTLTPKAGCRLPFVGLKSSLTIKDNALDSKDQIKWKWVKGSATLVTDFGDPTNASGDNGYYLCIYNAGARVSSTFVPPGGQCGTKPCWKTKSTGFAYKDKDLTPDGALSGTLKAGIDGKAQAKLTAKGVNVDTPNITTFTTGPIVVQLQREDGAICFQATFSSPFKKNANGTFNDKAD